MGLAPTVMDHFAESASIITDEIMILKNATICVNNFFTTSRTSINVYFFQIQF